MDSIYTVTTYNSDKQALNIDETGDHVHISSKSN